MAEISSVKFKITGRGKPISPDLFGVFFEDLNYAADGGLYAELIQNRSFEYQATEQPDWNNLTGWDLVQRGGGQGNWLVDASNPICPGNPHYVVLRVVAAGAGVGLLNGGFDGIAVAAGEQYDWSLFARKIYMNDAWGPGSAITGPMPMTARLESAEGEVIGESRFEVSGREWTKLTGTFIPNRTDASARFVLLAHARGGLAIDEVSLMPRRTFRNRRNGLRPDLAQAIADLRPRFLRFPGGCLAHGNGVGNFYRWKDTVGPVERRRGQANIWGYHQSVGLGYFEYFQFCEDIGAMPLPVVPAGVSCQNSSYTCNLGQQLLPMEQMPAFIRDVLDLIEWANGSADSEWGRVRAQAGHAQPFGLRYLGVGNEDHITPGFEERFKMIFDAVRQNHPEITVVGTVGPSHSGPDYERGWALARQLNVPVVDEHYYVAPDWFWDNLNFYDRYPRGGTSVYLGEYAAHEPDRRSTLRSALAEAAYMTALERNGDVVQFASYAPLLAKRGRTQWTPDLIYFDNTTITPTINYYVQRLFGHNGGDLCLPLAMDSARAAALAASCVRDSRSGDVIVKIVSRADGEIALALDLAGAGVAGRTAKCWLLSGDPDAENGFAQVPSLMSVLREFPAGERFDYVAPPHSLSVIRLTASGTADGSAKA